MPRLHRHAHSTHRRERRSTSAATAPDRSRSDASRRPADRHGSVRHRRDTRVGAANGRTASVLCLMAAFLAFITTVVAELIAHTRQEPANLLLSLVAGLFALAALATGGYAQTVQLRYWSRRVRNRLLIGLPVGLLTLGTASMNVYRQQVPVEKPEAPVPSVALAPGLAGEDRALFKPGWYGEGQQDGVLAVVTSYEENAAEARAFNRIVTEPVAYAVLTVINLGSPLPVVLSRTRVTLLLESGEEVQSLEVKPLMRLAALDDRMRQRLAEPRTVVPGAMAADIPVCLDSNFRWQRVRAVKVALQAGDLLVAGRMLTAEEKQALMERSAAGKNAVTNLSAEVWFKDL